MDDNQSRFNHENQWIVWIWIVAQVEIHHSMLRWTRWGSQIRKERLENRERILRLWHPILPAGRQAGSLVAVSSSLSYQSGYYDTSIDVTSSALGPIRWTAVRTPSWPAVGRNSFDSQRCEALLECIHSSSHSVRFVHPNNRLWIIGQYRISSVSIVAVGYWRLAETVAVPIWSRVLSLSFSLSSSSYTMLQFILDKYLPPIRWVAVIGWCLVTRDI